MIISQFNRIEEIKNTRRLLRASYIGACHEILDNGWDYQSGLENPKTMPYRFVLVAPYREARDDLRNYLISKNIVAKCPIDEDDLLFRQLDYSTSDFPRAWKLYNTMLSIPMYPGLTADEHFHIIKSLESYYD